MADPILLNAVPFFAGSPDDLLNGADAFALMGGTITGDNENIINQVPIGEFFFCIYSNLLTTSSFTGGLVKTGAGAPVDGTNSGMIYLDTSASNKIYISADNGATWLAASV